MKRIIIINLLKQSDFCACSTIKTAAEEQSIFKMLIYVIKQYTCTTFFLKQHILKFAII